MSSQTGQQIITMDILPIIPRRKDNQTMKPRQLIEYNFGNIFLENYTPNVVEKLVSDPLIKKPN